MQKSRRISIFEQHGVIFSSIPKEGENVDARGRCIFCGKDDHFYANLTTKGWDCKSCGAQGGFHRFLSSVYLLSRKNATKERLKKLAAKKNLPVSILESEGIGYNPHTDKYIHPVYRLDDQNTLWDLRHCRIGGRFFTSVGCASSIIGWDKIKQAKRVWICEGEWDRLAMLVSLKEAGVLHNEYAVAKPGASIFKSEWVDLFSDRDVIIVGDNDKAGKLGNLRTWNRLLSTANSLHCVHWREGTSDKYDIRDEFIAQGCDGKKTYEALNSLLRDTPYCDQISSETPATQIITNQPDQQGKSNIVSEDSPRIPSDDVYKKYKQWFHMTDDMTLMIDLLYGTIIANRIQGDPLWVFFVGPPGSLKTELLLSVVGSPRIEYTDTLTPAGLISGATSAGGGDLSLLSKFDRSEGKMLIIEDFSPILSMAETFTAEILAILRAAYNGKAKRVLGTVTKEFKNLHFGILSGVTPIIEQYLSKYSALGERFLCFPVPVDGGIAGQYEYLRRSQSNIGSEKKLRGELKDVARSVLSHDYSTPATVPEEIGEKLINCSILTAFLRGVVTRDRYTKEITHKPYIELGTRLVKQFTKAAIGSATFRGKREVDERAYTLAKSLALGSIPRGSVECIRAMYYDSSREWSVDDVADVVGLPARPTIHRIMQNLQLLGAVRREANQVGPIREKWFIDPEMYSIIVKSGVFS